MSRTMRSRSAAASTPPAASVVATFADNADHLAAELTWLNRVLHRAVLAQRAQSRGEAEAFKGLYLSDAEIDRLLQGAGAAPVRFTPSAGEEAVAVLRQELDDRLQASIAANVPLALPQLAGMFGLLPLERQILLLALAPEIDLSYEKVFAYLQDDFHRRRPTVDLALTLLCQGTQERMAARALITSSSSLFRFSLLRPLDRADGPVLAQPLIADELTAAFLLRAGVTSRELAQSLRPLVTTCELDDLRWLADLKSRLLALIRAFLAREASSRRFVCHLHGPDGTGRKTLAAALCAAAGVPLLVADLRDVLQRAGSGSVEDGLRDLFRQAILRQAALYLDHADCLVGEEEQLDRHRRALGRTVDELSWMTFVATTRPWPTGDLFAAHTYLSLPLPAPDAMAREQLWARLAADADLPEVRVNWPEIAARFRLTPGAMRAALHAARDLALLRAPDAPLTTRDLIDGCYSQSNRRLGGLARKLTLARGWDDLTLPPNTRAQLEELCSQVRHRRRVHDEWGFARVISLGKGLCALFYGASGVGKTMAVEVIARELELEVYKIDLSTVVSKYIGETEKNLGRIFDEAETSNAMLFFDEADALFGKRSEVKDAHDRYANIEINYLLQRIEEFEGLVILASNLRKHIDDGFFRRMQFAIEFPLPEADDRYRIWRQHIPSSARVSSDVDFAFLAERIVLAGGHIRNIVINAAFLAASEGDEIRMAHMVRATRREYEKIGRVTADSEFGPYQALLKEGP